MSEPTLDPHVAGWLVDTEPGTEPATVAEARELSRRTNALALVRMDPSLVPASETDRQLDSPGGPIPVRVLRPAGDGPCPTVVYFHGGGWVVGDIDTHLGHARRICTQAGAVVVSVGYHCAPEQPFPAAFDDAIFATDWAAGHLGELGGDVDTLVVAGDSAGGQLAASVALARRDAGRPLAAQLLLYPVTDASGRYLDAAINDEYPSRASADRGLGLTMEGMANFATYYVDADHSADWRVSPFRADHFDGVAPAVVHTATLDILRSEGNFYAQALERAGVRVISREWPTLNHSYFGLGGVSAVADAAAAQAAEDLRTLLAERSASGT